ncbi:hypothetical protein [Bacteroides sp. GM023]|uniref:hypothetical protein n=1 Tax=Bacteroides sp. GM023 TaxID=2723058 RepID=UPI00168C0530|nr:hypothetical protein [Bacteroides sp. GM023]MBD3589558.1 hypothetical protein [Bacteroides sp. GM023]
MKSNGNSVKGAQANKAAVLGNVVTNNKKEETIPLLLLPTTPQEKPQEKNEVKEKPQEKTVKQEVVEAPKKSSAAMSIDTLMDKADRTYLLRQKYQEIREKRKQLEAFTISHDKNNAQLTLVDAKGLTISTSNPVSISKLLADWMDDLNIHLKKTEDEIRAELESLN